ncbi:MAG: MBL fold metallo-hydrolase RNA specificity domain-containing protein [Mycobacterium leprae]
MRLTFLGACGVVTGSCYLVEAGGLRLLIDCGLFQGRDEEWNTRGFPFDAASIDGVILTHAHIDHAGRLPLLYEEGFRGPIYAHPATADLAAVMLRDSAHILAADAERANRKAIRAGRPEVSPLYNVDTTEELAGLFEPVPYDELIQLPNSEVKIRLQDAGHILGSAMVEVFEPRSGGRSTKLVFSGDLGQRDRPFLQDPTLIADADYLVLESTYGDRLHQPLESTRNRLAEIIRETRDRNGNVVIPAFAIGRAQELIYELSILMRTDPDLKGMPIMLDSPLAAEATTVTMRHQEVFDTVAAGLMDTGKNPFKFPGLVTIQTTDESKALNQSDTPMVIIAAGGMCENGRIIHHLKHNLWRPESTILFAGYQAEGTLGRRLLDQPAFVRIHGEEIAVRASIESLPGLSAHADQAQLLQWVEGLRQPPVRTFLVHGEETAREALGELLTDRGHKVVLPGFGDSATLSGGQARVRVALPMATALLPEGGGLLDAVRQELEGLAPLYRSKAQHLSGRDAAELAQRLEEARKHVADVRRRLEEAGD